MYEAQRGVCGRAKREARWPICLISFFFSAIRILASPTQALVGGRHWRVRVRGGVAAVLLQVCVGGRLPHVASWFIWHPLPVDRLGF